MARLISALAVALAAWSPPAGGVTVRIVSPQEANSLVESRQAILVDVREWEEVKGGMAEPARWMPTSLIDSEPDRFGAWLRGNAGEREVIFYCARGLRAGKAAAEASRLGFRSASMGGFRDWVAAGLPVRIP